MGQVDLKGERWLSWLLAQCSSPASVLTFSRFQFFLFWIVIGGVLLWIEPNNCFSNLNCMFLAISMVLSFLLLTEKYAQWFSNSHNAISILAWSFIAFNNNTYTIETGLILSLPIFVTAIAILLSQFPLLRGLHLIHKLLFVLCFFISTFMIWFYSGLELFSSIFAIGNLIIYLLLWFVSYIVFSVLATSKRWESSYRKLFSEHEHLSRTTVREKEGLELELVQARKMEALGRLSGGIAHDFNNVLAAISGYADLLDRKFGKTNPSITKYTKTILDACNRASGMISQLLAFTRKGKYQKRVINVHQAVDGVLQLLRHSLTKKIRVHTKFLASPALISGDPDQLQNALVNLAINSRDAMPEGGDLKIETSLVILGPDQREEHLRAPELGDYLCLMVQDTGIGMSKETADQVFEPYFTTKQHGKGTGLGLAGVYGFIQNHDGFIHLESELGVGTTFRLYFPVTDVQGDSVGMPINLSARIKTGKGRIMVIDDESPIRDLIQEMLTRVGYEPIVFSNGDDAVEFFKTQHSLVDLIMLDMIMPQKDGNATFFEMKEIDPNLKVLILSGYSKNEQVQHLIDQGALGHLQKPFQYSELTEIVHRTING